MVLSVQLQNGSKGPAKAQKRPGQGQPVGFVTKKARTAPVPTGAVTDSGAGAGSGSGGFDPMQMMQMMMQMMAQMPGGAGGVAATAPTAPADSVWKSKFHELLSKNQVTDKPAYTVEEVEGGGYIGNVTIQEHSFQGEAAKGKKNAEQLAAKAAIQQLFPDDFKNVAAPPNQIQNQKKGKGQQPKAKPELEGKNLLNHNLNMYMRKHHDRCCQKDDKKFETEQTEGGYVTTLTLSEGLAGRSFQGDVCRSKGDAENSAAEEAVRALQDVFAPIEEERQALKKQKNAEALAKLKEAQARKKEAKAAGEQLAITA